uniref:Uncharacterized protein n=1 Tax=Anguilla anguilla TaxID=7936 RepID=A0A0E9Q9P4_ANGAN
MYSQEMFMEDVHRFH